MRSTVLALCVASATAFAPTPVVRVATSLEAAKAAPVKAAAPVKKAAPAPVKKAAPAPAKKAAAAPVKKAAAVSNSAFASEIGAQPPIGLWDPLNLLANADQARFDRLREVELKHGRISMLAVVGHLTTTAGYRWDAPVNFSGLKFSDIPSGLGAISAIPALGAVQILAFVGWLEFYVFKDVTGTAEFAGDFRNNFLDFGWDSFTEEQKLSKRGIELNNGRAAQMGILALMVHEKLNGDPYIINTLLGHPVTFN